MTAEIGLLDLARDIASRAEGAEEVEAFVVHEREFQVRAFAGEVESLSAAEPRGVGVRVARDHRIGFAYTSDLSEEGVRDALAKARANAGHAGDDPAFGLASPAGEASDVAGIFDESQAAVTAEEKVDFVLTLERATRGADPRIKTVEDAVYSDSISEIAIATSTGISGAYKRTDAWCYSVAIAVEGDDTEIGFEFDLGRSLHGLDPEETARRAADRALGALGASKIPSARMPVVFDPYTAGQFLGVIGGVLTAEAVQKGRSLFAGRLGEAVATSHLSLVDDGRAEGAPGARPWDAEGVPSGRTDVIRDGILESYLYDTVSARRESRASTGNAARAGFKSAPGPSPSNMSFEPTGETREQVLERAGRAFLVRDFHGVHSGANPISGDFSVGATGFLLDGGAPSQPVKEVTIAAPMLEILRSVEAVGDDRRWLPFGGSFGGATTLVAEMTVAGT